MVDVLVDGPSDRIEQLAPAHPTLPVLASGDSEANAFLAEAHLPRLPHLPHLPHRNASAGTPFLSPQSLCCVELRHGKRRPLL